jgi:aminopeptidase N
VVIGDPGIPFLFNDAVYVRGAMTLQALRNEVGDQDFFRILRAWAAKKAGGNGTTGQFIALAERISGEQLDNLFDVWLFTAGKPTSAAATGTTALAPRTARRASR